MPSLFAKKFFLVSSIAVLAATLFLFQNCAGDGDGGTNTVVCDNICKISNGAASASATTYWQVQELNCGGFCYAKIAFFADGTGKLLSETTNCVVGSTPAVVTFTWTQTGPDTMLMTGATYACSPNSLSTGGTLGSFTTITGSISAGVFQAKLNGTGPVQGALLSGTF